MKKKLNFMFLSLADVYALHGDCRIVVNEHADRNDGHNLPDHCRTEKRMD